MAVDSVVGWLTEQQLPREVTFCCFEEEDVRLYQEYLRTNREQAP